MSYDMGATWNVVHTQMGGCMTDSVNIDVPIPSSAPSGEALFGWTWFNHAGNREMYMNCAVVTVQGGGSGLNGPAPFVANAGVNQCATIEGIDTVFPNPGDSVSYGGSYASSRPTAAAGFTGSNCVAPGASSGSGSGSTDDDDDEDETTSIQATATSTVATSSTMAAISTESSASSSTFSDEEYSTTSTYAASSSAAASSTEAATSTSAAVPIPTASMPSSSADPASTTGRVCRIKKRSASPEARSLHPGQKLVTRRKAAKEHRRSRIGRIGHIGH